MKNYISILGSTGSIGLTVFKIIKKKRSFFVVNILAANKNYQLICKQIEKFKPKIFLINDYQTFLKVKKKYRNKNIKIINKFESKNSRLPKSDITIAAIPGIAGLQPTIDLIKNSKKILIANKESIICGWNIIKKNALTNINNNPLQRA